MAGASVRSSTHCHQGARAVGGGQGRPVGAVVDISALEELPDSSLGATRLRWAKGQDEALLKYWPTKRHIDVARILGHSKDSCLARYRELTCRS